MKSLGKVLLFFFVVSTYAGDIKGGIQIEAGIKKEISLNASVGKIKDGWNYVPKIPFIYSGQIQNEKFIWGIDGFVPVLLLTAGGIYGATLDEGEETNKYLDYALFIPILIFGADIIYRTLFIDFGVTHRFRWLMTNEFIERIGGVIYLGNEFKIGVNPYFLISNKKKNSGLGVGFSFYFGD